MRITAAMTGEKIGLLGGTFDPVHVGHLAAAKAALLGCDLDTVWFIPAVIPPHKAGHGDGQPITPFEHRAAMLQLALADEPHYVLSLIEAERQTPSYTIDTLTVLRQRCGERARFFFIIGIDAFVEIATWKAYKRLPEQTDFVVLARPGHDLSAARKIIRQHYNTMQSDDVGTVWSSATGGGAIRILAMAPVPVSSTAIRQRLGTGQSIDRMVLPTVAGYIKQHGLYAMPA